MVGDKRSYWCQAGCTLKRGSGRVTTPHIIIFETEDPVANYSLWKTQVLRCTTCGATRHKITKKQTEEQKWFAEARKCRVNREGTGLPCRHKKYYNSPKGMHDDGTF